MGHHSLTRRQTVLSFVQFLAASPLPRGQVHDDTAIEDPINVFDFAKLAKEKRASAVGIARPYLYGLAAFGRQGVERVLELLKTELALDMGMAGVSRISEIDRQLVKDSHLVECRRGSSRVNLSRARVGAGPHARPSAPHL